MVGSAACLSSVSYTHLDVYKRQVDGLAHRAIVRHRSGCAGPVTVRVSAIDQPTPDEVTVGMDEDVWPGADAQVRSVDDPVSYTHLDVYKRQRWNAGCPSG